MVEQKVLARRAATKMRSSMEHMHARRSNGGHACVGYFERLGHCSKSFGKVFASLKTGVCRH